MIPSRVAVDSTAKNNQTDSWDLTSSLTGTVKRRPLSLESSKSNSPTKSEGKIIDFPDDKRSKNAKDVVQKVEVTKPENSGTVDYESLKKIDKKRFGKLAQSAKKSFSKLPNRVSLARRTSPNRKLSLSQLEQQNNLFIRDGQKESCTDNKGELKINKVEESKNVVMEPTAEKNNPKQKHDKSKKSSLIPAFLGGSGTKSANHIKIPSTSTGSIKNAPSNVVDKLTKTGNKFKELYRDFPSVSPKKTQAPPPPYRLPPPPKKIRFDENDAKNYEEIDTIIEEHVFAVDDGNEDIHNDIRDGELLSKAEYTSNVFKNIPVRQKKGTVPHMDNYCLFDPSVDFTNEKDLIKKKLAGVQFPMNLEGEEKIEDVTFEDQTVYDVSELEREKIIANHNYYEIDPDLLLEEDEENEVEEKQQMEIAAENVQALKNKHRKSKVYSNTMSMSSSESTSTSQTSTNSSSTSSDYPSLFNSVIETTHSSTVESTDDNDSNGYGKTTAQPNGDTINQVNVTAVSNESVITISNVVTCGDPNASTTGATKKKSPQLNRIIRPTRNAVMSKQPSKTKPTRKSESSSLQNVTVQNRCRQTNSGDLNFVIDNTTTIQLRRQRGRPLSGHSEDRDSGFLSPVTPPDSQSHSTHITPNVTVKESEHNTKSESTVLNQCDNVQQLIEVSNSRRGLISRCEFRIG